MYKPNIDYYEGDDKDKIKELLKTVKLYELYNTLEQELKINPNVGTCNQRCSAKLQGGSKEMLDLLNLCKGICNIISKVRDIYGFCSRGSCSTSFMYMSIWLYDHVNEITKSDSEINVFYTALKSIMETKETEFGKDFITNFSIYKKEFLPMKYICEFFHIYIDIMDKISGNYNLEVELYCKHIKKFFQYYNQMKEYCNSTQKPIYCSTISKLKTTIFDTNKIETIYDKCKYEATSCNNKIVVRDDLPCLKKKDISTLPARSGDINYIFTPLGVYLRSRISKKKNIHNHVGQENYDLLKYTSNVEEISPDNRRYNVMYQ
ncbi:unnamed protein product [Plasmodium vivax]|uniref:(malaria parasite P. vivax) hypothetical protein n=1 Tax=Plasmodium vivax TaxID=5855 RepID=A0A8S4H484_PLAVI|nr:unnamed protein product [Plasmodium vivax]